VPDSALLNILTGAGVAGAFCVLFLIGAIFPRSSVTELKAENARKDEVIGKLQDALDLERQRSNDATQAASVTNQLIGALTTLATEHRAMEKHEHKEAADVATARAIAGTPGLDGSDQERQ
jgi:hypothetical protein